MEDFEQDRLMLHEIAVSAGSGRALGFELNVEKLRTLLPVERFGRLRKGLRCFFNRRRVAAGGLDGPRYYFRPSQAGHPVALPLCLPFRSQFLSSSGDLSGPVLAPSLRPSFGVMVLVEADLARPWLPAVLASDASLSGFGVAQSC